MQILVDADACPVARLVEQAAKARGLPVTLLCRPGDVVDTRSAAAMNCCPAAEKAACPTTISAVNAFSTR